LLVPFEAELMTGYEVSSMGEQSAERYSGLCGTGAAC